MQQNLQELRLAVHSLKQLLAATLQEFANCGLERSVLVGDDSQFVFRVDNAIEDYSDSANVTLRELDSAVLSEADQIISVLRTKLGG